MPVIVNASSNVVLDTVMLTVIDEALTAPNDMAVMFLPAVKFKIGVPVGLNCQPVGASRTTWSVPIERSELTVSVTVIVPIAVSVGVLPKKARLLQMFVPPDAGLTDTCAKPGYPAHSIRRAIKAILLAFIRSLKHVNRTANDCKEGFFILLVLNKELIFLITGKLTKKRLETKKIR